MPGEGPVPLVVSDVETAVTIIATAVFSQNHSAFPRDDFLSLAHPMGKGTAGGVRV